MAIHAIQGREAANKARPTLLLLGPTGSGKTRSLGFLAHAGYRVAVVDIERKCDAIAADDVLIITPDNLGDIHELYELLADKTRRQKFVQAHSEWEDIDLIGIDSLLEFERLCDLKLRAEYPEKKGDKSYERWDQYGLRIVNFAKDCCDLASIAQDAPIGVIITLGLGEKETAAGFQQRYLLKGNIAPMRLPFQTSFIFKLDVDEDEEGNVQWWLKTAGKGLKTPGTHVLPPRIDVTVDNADTITPDNPRGFARAWKKLDDHVRARRTDS